MVEAFSTFLFKTSIEKVSLDKEILKLIPDEATRDYFQNSMYRLILNNESHLEEAVRTMPEDSIFKYLYHFCVTRCYICVKGKNLHPTQKPVSILKKIINIASNENDIVLDCFNGVGSTGEAALEINRKYIGIEIEKEYMNATYKRLLKFAEDKPRRSSDRQHSLRH